MDNPVRKIRKSLGLNQADFGRMIGRSHQSVRNYENGIGEVPAEVVERLKSLAAEKGLADIALELTSDDWQIRHGETLISTARKGADAPAVAGRDILHGLVDAVLDGGDEASAQALRSVINVIARGIRSPVVVRSKGQKGK